jgi:Flp pilus assembly pilin Flp
MIFALHLSIRNWLNGEEGQSLVVYGLILAVIVLVVAVAVAALGDDLVTYLGAVVKAVAMTWFGGGTG